ncbi:MAG: hypothetical protein VX730_07055 [Pseudomonadota bacterium]|nr:hypothetical protein [Pseudomonadota bacterium]
MRHILENGAVSAKPRSEISSEERAVREAGKAREEVLKELLELDTKLRRDVEDVADAASLTLSEYLEGIRARKQQLRAQL